MANELPPQLYETWLSLHKEKSIALDNRDQLALTQIDAKIVLFARNNSIDLSQHVVLDPNLPPANTIKADQIGVDKNSMYKIKELTAGTVAKGSTTDNATDGKKSTIAKVSDFLKADLGGIGVISTVALKLDGTNNAFTFEYSTDDKVYTGIPMGAAVEGVTSNEFDYFTFPQAVYARYIKINHPGDFGVITLEILDKVPGTVPPIVVPPGPGTGTGSGMPVPAGFALKGNPVDTFKFWGRTTTNYASGGAGPSLRWDCSDVQDVNVLAGYEFNLGTKHGKRGDDNIDLKCRGDSHDDKHGGWYIPWISWHGDGKSGEYGCGKEYPHPSTSHDPFNVEDKKVDVGNIKDGQWHGFLVAVFNDKQGVPTMMAWFNPTASGKIEDYKYLGKSKDTGNMKPGPICVKIAQMGGGKQSLQMRMDEVPDAKVRNTYACALGDTPE